MYLIGKYQTLIVWSRHCALDTHILDLINTCTFLDNEYLIKFDVSLASCVMSMTCDIIYQGLINKTPTHGPPQGCLLYYKHYSVEGLPCRHG